ncbi:hypothetical protein K488DRAFT_86300 [Vararia minispora EC-137]|uniref:Uncharacterized protein n=1 Tax=Vararia minispora EC-137 TaxID=1314806 RepID=A0ACB8QJV4_9AGAM|nr:hypothetical protein K488DRAFT_86300 [Vararia minispora EC-137]
MSHLSAPVLLVWTVMGALLGAFYALHLWAFDRFRCLRWNHGTSQGTFKRIMTYSYMLAVPLLLTYTFGFTVIKYQEGMLYEEGFGVIPKPYTLWTDAHRQAILPLYLCLSLAISFEVITHLEETCFWLYVVSAGPVQVSWFRSTQFKIWVAGSIAAILYAPLTTIFTRKDSFTCESATFLAFAIGSGLVTLIFLPVLYAFPGFLDGLRRENVSIETIVRLTKFHELNKIRVLFRLMFVVPITILAVDGLWFQVLARSVFATDILSVVPAVGIIISSGITLLIFFPRDTESELERKTARTANLRPPQQAVHAPRFLRKSRTGSRSTIVRPQYEPRGTYDAERYPGARNSYDGLSMLSFDEPSSAMTSVWRRSDKPGPSVTVEMPSVITPSSVAYTQTVPAIGVSSFEVRLDSSARRAATEAAARSSPELGVMSVGRDNMSRFVYHFRSPIDFREVTWDG